MRIPAIRVHQWLESWDRYNYDEESRQRKPLPYFYLCSISAPLLRRLSGIRRRSAKGARVDDIGIQRGHDEARSREISRFVDAGYPWATLNTRQQGLFPDLEKPGWLPTAVVGNLVSTTTDRLGVKAKPNEVINIELIDDQMAHLVLPDGSIESDWEASVDGLPPIEIIDGQHRLYAFSDDERMVGDFDLPVVLFDDLDISWQAYLFWTINITPRRINPSMAYDLYPLLRTVRWLETVEGPMAYRETRAQELTEALWSHPDSSWRNRIGMLGRERGKVTQAAFVRSLTLSFVRGWAGSRRTGIGGFFGTEQSQERSDVLPWTRAQQAAYLIALWSGLEEAIRDRESGWTAHLRNVTHSDDTPTGHDAAFAGRYAMLATDQGVRGFLQVCNDISYQNRSVIPFREWRRATSAEATDIHEVSAALDHLREQREIGRFVRQLTRQIARFDWRSAVTPGLDEAVANRQSRYRSGSGYKQVRLQLLRQLARRSPSNIAKSANAVSKALGYDKE